MAADYFVCLENRIGEAHWTRFDSKETFEELYDNGRMDDETLVSIEYPRIPYQGIDEKFCCETAVARNNRLLEKTDVYSLMKTVAELGDWEDAVEIYRRFFKD